MKKNISSRRILITAILLLLAVAGGIIRLLVPPPSALRDMGSLLLVLWLPIIGNIIAFVVARTHALKKQPPGFDPAAPFEPTARLELTLLPSSVPAASRPVRAGLFACTVAVGNEGFTSRLRVPDGDPPLPEVPMALDVQFLRPDLALPRLAPGTPFILIAGRETLGRGVMLAQDQRG